MIKSAFRHAFEQDLARTAIADETLGARALRADPRLQATRPAELIAGGRTALAAGRLEAGLGPRFVGALLDLGLWAEALPLLQDRAADLALEDGVRRLMLARAMAAAGDLAEARGMLASLSSLPHGGERLARRLAQGLSPEAVNPAKAVGAAGELCALGLADLAAGVLEPHFASPETAPLEAAYDTLRLVGGPAAARLLAAMAPVYRADGRQASLDATLEVLAGGEDRGVEPESAESGARLLLLRACLAEACAAARLWPAAIRRFDFVGRKWREPPDSFLELARCVGRDLLDGRPVRLAPRADGEPRWFDVFPYNGEADMLQLKLGEMASWVERFVLLEADETFPGRPKPLYFQDDPARAAGSWLDRIVHLVAARPPAHIDYTWAREFFQKDGAVLGLEGLARPDDFVVLSDADEIVDRAAIAGFDGDLAAGDMRSFRYFLNCELVSATPILKTTITRARLAAAHGWNYLRLGAIRYRRPAHLKAAGWHFSSIGGPEWLAYKMQCTAHEEWSYQDQDFWRRFLFKMKRETGRGQNFSRREIDASFPAAVRERRTPLAEFIL